MNDTWNRVFGHRVASAGECLEFQGARMRSGYGKLSYAGANTTAHRVSWALANDQPLPEGRSVVVRHSCDNPPCVSPEHLTAGTPRENTQDMFAKGRHGWGARPDPPRPLSARRQPGPGPRDPADHPSAVLTWEKVAEIRARRADGATVTELMADFGVGRTSIRYVLIGRNWSPSKAPQS